MARFAFALTLGAAATATVAAAPAAAAKLPTAEQLTRLVVLERPQVAYARADAGSKQLEIVADHRPITGERTILPILGESTGSGGRTWINVMLPGRPNGHTGWIAPSFFRYTSTSWRLRVSIGQRLVTVYHSGRVVRRYKTVVGKPSTPTPRGRFFVEETLVLSGGKVGAPFALALSARSPVYQQFDGGPGQIALHGLGNVGGVPGTAVSHGCMRLNNSAIRWLADRMGPGVPVTITG